MLGLWSFAYKEHNEKQWRKVRLTISIEQKLLGVWLFSKPHPVIYSSPSSGTRWKSRHLLLAVILAEPYSKWKKHYFICLFSLRYIIQYSSRLERRYYIFLVWWEVKRSCLIVTIMSASRLMWQWVKKDKTISIDDHAYDMFVWKFCSVNREISNRDDYENTALTHLSKFVPLWF